MVERTLLQSLGDEIARARRATGMDQRELAERIGKTASYLSRIESGIAMPSMQVAEDIANGLNLEREHLQRLVLGAQVVKLVGSRLNLDELKMALRYLSSDDSPLDQALAWTVEGLGKPAGSNRRGRE